MTELLTQLAVGVSALAALALALWHQRRKGRSEGHRQARTEIETEVRNDVETRVDSGRKAVERGRSSGADPAQRLRDNDQNWM